jgi:2-aminoadipate transaminase
MNWETLFADRTRLMKRSTVREILKLTAHPEVISFAGGLPAPDLFPIERIEQAVTAVLAERGHAALQYSTSEGVPELRQWIARRLSDGGRWQISPDQVLITGGAFSSMTAIASWSKTRPTSACWSPGARTSPPSPPCRPIATA